MKETDVVKSNAKEKIREVAILRHEIDAPFFQDEYGDGTKNNYSDEFLYGRYMINDEIDRLLETLPPGSKVLDVGSGTGHLASYIKNKGFTVYGLEPSQNMLKFARSNFPDIDFREGISVELPFDNDTFDLVISIEVLRYLHKDEVKESYKEILRVLKKDGVLFTTHVNKYASDFYYFFYYLKKGVKKIQKELYHNCYFTTPEKEVKILSKIGYEKSWAFGRMYGSIRIGYKFGKKAGKAWAKLLERFSKNQRSTSGISRDLAGHLFVLAQK